MPAVLLRSKEFALQFVVDDHRDDHTMPAEDTAREPFRYSRDPGAPLRMRDESKRGGIKNQKAAHGNSSRSPVAARFSFIALMNSFTSSSAARICSGSVVAS